MEDSAIAVAAPLIRIVAGTFSRCATPARAKPAFATSLIQPPATKPGRAPSTSTTTASVIAVADSWIQTARVSSRRNATDAGVLRERAIPRILPRATPRQRYGADGK